MQASPLRPWRRVTRGVVAALALAAWPAPADIPYAPVMIYYDQASPTDNDGKISANGLRNLLGHFKTTVDATNVSSYTPGQLARYEAVFYLGSVYGLTNVPLSFIGDVMASTTTVVWLRYNLWQLPGFTGAGTNRFGIHYEWGQADTSGYDTVEYKGERLHKSGTLTRISVSNFVTVLATATSRANAALPPVPYAVRASNFWYVADNVPRSQILADRSLVLADLLHDILKAGTSAPRRALARIEDNAPALTSKSAVTAVSSALRELGVSATFGIIPRYRDPLGKYTNEYPADVRMSENREFLRTLGGVLRDGHEFAAHGYTHESGDAESGSGYEFWSTNSSSPLVHDSWDWCAGRVTNALTELLTCGFPVTCWETPHYMASLVDYPVFSETFRYSHERARVFAAFTDGMSRTDLNALSAANPAYTDQWFPYVIHKSCYGNMFLPENIDRFSTSAKDPNGLFLTISNKIDYARKLTVVRDAVGGFYFHPQYGRENLTNLVRQIMELGYTFASPGELSREEPVATRTNDAWATSNTVRTFTAATNLLADLVVGDAGAGNRVIITNGATVANEGALLGITALACSNAVFVTDPASTWVNRRPITVGQHGPANGVAVRFGGSVLAPETVLGLHPESSRNGAMVTETNSVWNNRYGFIIGQASSSNGLAIMNGGRVTGLYGEIGATTNANGNFVTVMDPGSLWSNSQYVVVGNAGAANSLMIQSSGRVVSAFGLVGARSNANANAVMVFGPGSCWSNSANLMIGVDAQGNSLTISNGACVSCANAIIGNYSSAAANRIDIEADGALLVVQQGLVIGADGFDNEVRVATGGIAHCGSISVGRDAAGPGNALTVTGGTVVVTGTVDVCRGLLNLAAGSLQADAIIVAPGSLLNLAPGFDLRTRALTLGGDFITPGTNTGLDLLRSTLTFTTGAVHQLQLDSEDRGASLAGFPDNRALGTLEVEGTVAVTNVCYAWTLSGAGILRIRSGSRVYYLTKEGWTGSVILEGDGQLVPVSLAIDSIAPTTGAAMRLSWAAASGLTFAVGWAEQLVPAGFTNAASLLSTSTNEAWVDEGGAGRPHPSVVTQRFYRLDAHP
jgi:T5SS/PEP-CTERM-associated repeat protein